MDAQPDRSEWSVAIVYWHHECGLQTMIVKPHGWFRVARVLRRHNFQIQKMYREPPERTDAREV